MRSLLPKAGWTSRWMIVLLLSAALVLTAALALNAFVAERGRQRATDRAMQDYAGFAAWQMSKLVRDNTLAALFVAFLPAAQRPHTKADEDAFTAAELARVTTPQQAGCECLRKVAAYIRYDVPSARFDLFAMDSSAALDSAWALEAIVKAVTLPQAVRTARRVPSFSAGPPAAQGLGASVSQGVVIGGSAKEPRALSFTILRTRSGTPISVYAFVVPAESFFGPIIQRVLRADRLLPNVGPPESAPKGALAVEVTTASGTTLFATEAAQQGYRGTDSLAADMGSLRVAVTLSPALMQSLAVDRPSSVRLPLLIGLSLFIAFVLIAAAVQLRRQEDYLQLRSGFIAGVSHELRTPLAQIRLLAELLASGKPRDEARRTRAAEIIDQEARRLAFLVENILSFGRTERGAMHLAVAPTRLSDLVSDVVDAFDPLARDRGSSVRVMPGGAMDVDVLADPAALKQMLLNLLDNAVRYGKSPQTIRIEAAIVANEVRLSVEDEGPGVPPAERERIWKAYYRMARHIDGVEGGSGLGLAVVADLATRQTGRAWVEGGAAGGARFVIALGIAS